MLGALHGGYFMVQEKYVAEAMSTYMAVAKTLSTPFEPGSDFGIGEVQMVEGLISG